jgi:hypothetical protein
MDPDTGRPGERYVADLFRRVREVSLRRQVDDTLGQLRRLDAGPAPDPGAQREVSRRLQVLQRELADLRAAGER